MDIGNAKVAAGISIKLFHELLREIQKSRLDGPQRIFNRDIEILSGIEVNAQAFLNLEPMNFGLHRDSAGDLYTRLDINGELEVFIDTDQIDPVKILTIPVNAAARIGFVLKERSGSAPVIGLAYNGIEEISDPLTEDQINDLLEERGFFEIIDSIELDILKPAYDAINFVYYDGRDSDYSTWPCELKLLERQTGYVDAVGIFIGIPGDTLELDGLRSFVPISSEVAFIFSRTMIDYMLRTIRQKMIDKILEAEEALTFNDVALIEIAINRSALHMRDEAIYINFDLSCFIANAYIRGEMSPNLIPGTTAVGMFTGDLDVNTDLHWILKIIKPLWDELDDAVDGAPGMVHSMLNEKMREITAKMGADLNLNEFSIFNIPVDIYPNNCKVEDGNIGLFSQVIIETISEPIVYGSYSKNRDRFIYYKLESGRIYQAKHLAQFVKNGRIITPGFHEVEGKYMRSNPDNVIGNNLLAQFQ